MQIAPDKQDAVAVHETSPQPQQAGADRPMEIDSASLLNGRQEMRINHDGSTYTLRRTRGGKLILTK